MWHNWAEKENGDINTDEENTTKKKTKKDSLMDEENISNQKKTTSQGRDIDVTEYASQTMGQGQWRTSLYMNAENAGVGRKVHSSKAVGEGGRKGVGRKKKKNWVIYVDVFCK